MMDKTYQRKITLSTGLALFAMFFGAGNVVFPLSIGATSGEHVWWALSTFLISGVGLPFLGVFAVLLMEGDYWKFFSAIGRVPAFLIIAFIILIIGPLFAGPRTEIVTFHTFLPFLPDVLKNNMIFSVLYFALVYVVAYDHSKIIDLIGWLISPIKLTMFFTLIFFGILTKEAMGEAMISTPAKEVVINALSLGYSTMDLLGAFFFSSVAYANIAHKCKAMGGASPQLITKIALKSCLIGSICIGLVYSGLIFSAHHHAYALQGTSAEDLLSKISFIVLGRFCSFFVCLCALFACVATASALVEVSTSYFHKIIFKESVSRKWIVLFVITWMYGMSLIGFKRIVELALPILNVLYPFLIILCLYNIFKKLRSNQIAVYSETATAPST